MRAELVVMGRRVDMARRARRRGLVVTIYAAMVALMAGMWFVDHWRGTSCYVFWLTMVACRLFLGGYYRGGLVKPFYNKIPREISPDTVPSLLALGLRVYNPLPQDDRSFLNDERELKERDHAHYLAYSILSVGIILAWFCAYTRMRNLFFLRGAGMALDQIQCGLLLALVLLVFTLPQAILLWTEPDMEEDGD
jgi:hypothetical protein